jgi:hypothetical protein
MSPLNQNEIPLSSEIWLDAKQLDRNRSTWAVTKKHQFRVLAFARGQWRKIRELKMPT